MLDGGVGLTPRPGRFTSGNEPVPTEYEAGWAHGPVWTGAENLASTGIRIIILSCIANTLHRIACQNTTHKLFNFSSHEILAVTLMAV